MSRLALYFLGTPRIERDDEIISLSHHKALALLAYLAVTRQRHTRQALAALLWPDYDPADARAEVRRMIWVLNKSLGPGWLEVDRQTIMLEPQPDLWMDVDDFRDRAEASRNHVHLTGEHCPDCLQSLMAAVALARGDFLAGFTLADSPDFDTWQTFETESLRRELSIVLERLVEFFIQSGDTTAGEPAISYARRWLALDPLHEPAHRQLMRLYCWAGQPAAALQQYQNCARVLETDLGVAPSTETNALFEAIKANRLTFPANRAAKTRLKTSSILQAAIPDAVRANHTPLLNPALADSLALPIHNLPVQATPFIGRKTTLDDLQQRLDNPAGRLITIIGPGGIGKTRLSLALAEKQIQPATAFTDGVYFISLAPIASPDTLVQTIAEGLDFPLSSVEEPATQLLTYLRHKQMLLVLDNFEHVLDGATLVSHILQTAAGVNVVVTSRERLNLAHETLWPVNGLNFAELTSVADALSCDAVRLFVQRARQVRPAFELRAEDLPHLKHILQAVWGMPLAIELAAAWLNMLSVAEIAAELSHGLDLLESELRDVPDRHRSMRLVFDRSWQRLTAEEQSLFKTLSVFRGSFSHEAVRQITGASLRVLAGLVNKSLLTSRPETGRYELHELLRQYAGEKLAADDLELNLLAHQAHATYYAALMQQSWTDLRSAKQQTALAALELDIENIRTAWRYRLAERNNAELLKFMDSFWMIHDIRGWHQAAIALFREAAEQMHLLTGDEVALVVRGKALGYESYYTGIIGNPERGLVLAQEAIDLLSPLNQPEALSYVFYCAALSNLYLGRAEWVFDVAEQLRQICQKTGDRWAGATALNFLATALITQHQYAEAKQLIDRAFEIFSQDIGEYFGRSWAALIQGRIALALGAYDEAKVYYHRSLSAAQVLNYRRTTQQSYDNLGDVAFHQGELAQAETYFRLSLEVSEETGQAREMVAMLYDLARVWAAQNQKSEAVELVAVVLCHPLSNLPLLLRTEGTTLYETAERFRAQLEADLEPQIYQAAWVKGQAQPIEAVVARLLR
ncbi:MAG: AAA family ATPase [Anaerolineaceae bacterium]|nr:AAA family ATPase [Anaerolineaceae bacterium]